MEDFKSLDDIHLLTQVKNSQDKTTLICPDGENKCRIRMNWANTPIIYGVYPAVLYYGQLSSVYINPMNAPNSKRSGDLPLTLKIDGFRMDHEDYLDEFKNLQNGNAQIVQGKVQTTSRNKNAELTAHFNGVGNALYNDVSAKTCNVQGDDCYFVRTVPSISSVDISEGYTSGGQELTITGHSFDANESIEVTVGDAVCTVKEFNSKQIKCETSAATMPADSLYLGSNGLYHARFNDTHEANEGNW